MPRIQVAPPDRGLELQVELHGVSPKVYTLRTPPHNRHVIQLSRDREGALSHGPASSRPAEPLELKASVSLQRMMQMKLTAVYMRVPEGYVAFVEELPGANTRGATLEEARTNLEEAVTMVMEANRELSELSLVGAEVIRETLVLPAV
jgi:predicted RNase H-like HicB family nuclease